MTALLWGDMMTPVTDERVERGQRLKAAQEARKKDGLSVAAFARAARLSKPTFYAAIAGTAEDATYDAYENALAEWDAHPEDRHPAPAILVERTDGLIEVEMGGVSNAKFNVERLIVRGPVDNVESLVEAAQKILASVVDPEPDEDDG